MVAQFFSLEVYGFTFFSPQMYFQKNINNSSYSDDLNKQSIGLLLGRCSSVFSFVLFNGWFLFKRGLL